MSLKVGFTNGYQVRLGVKGMTVGVDCEKALSNITDAYARVRSVSPDIE